METWNEVADRFAMVTDKLGKPIDQGIFETVVALNVLGVKTRQSCEGHLDWGCPFPWIDIQPEIEQKFKLHHYLHQFYTDRTINFDTLLVFHGYRLRPGYAPFFEILSPAVVQQKLDASRAEMAVFTTFLKSLVELKEITKIKRCSEVYSVFSEFLT